MAAWLTWLAGEEKHIIPDYDDLNGDQTERAILWEAVPAFDPDETVLSAAPVKALVLLHMALGLRSVEPSAMNTDDANAGLAEAQYDQVEHRAELLAQLVTLPPHIFEWMVDQKGLPLPISSKSLGKSTVARALSKPSSLQIAKHYEIMRQFFQNYVVAQIDTFNMLFDMGDHIQKALFTATSFLVPDCLACMNYRLQSSFALRAQNSEHFDEATIHTDKSFIGELTPDEVYCLKALQLQFPTSAKAAELMIPDIAHSYGEHSALCRSMHSHNSVAHMLYTAMWEASPGAGLIREAGPRGIVSYHERHNLPEIIPKLKPSETVEDDLKEDSVEFNDPTDKSPSKVASDLAAAHTKEPADMILKAPPLGSVWTVLFADRAERTIRRLARKNQGALIPVLKNIRMVSEGQWTNSVAKTLVAERKRAVLYECKVLNNVRIVWQVDIAYLESIKSLSQVIKVWSIGNHQDVIKTVEYVTSIHRSYTREHIERCEYQIIENGIVLPKVWPDEEEDQSHLVKVEDYFGLTAAEALKLHEMAVTAKFVPLSKMFMQFLVAGTDAPNDCEFPFAISQQEHRILNNDGSVIICGRSGTGKTSCSVFRMLADYQARRVGYSRSTSLLPNLSGGSEVTSQKYRQIFVTASPKFCQRVKIYAQHLLKSVQPSSLSAGTIEKFIQVISEASFDGDSEIVVDEEIFEEEYDTLEASANLLADESSGTELPMSFGDLTDADFPLFVHYKKLVSMIRVYLGLPEDPTKIEGEAADRNADFDRFSRIFKSLSPALTKDIDESLAFSEIMGIIKGSDEAARSKDGYLTRDQYLSASTKAYVTFNYNRNRIYDLFEAYSVRKLLIATDDNDPIRQDEQDRVNEINREVSRLLETNDPKLEGLLVNQIYIDEVQDLTMSQILPLITMCSDPQYGLMFAGDTAQVIARGSVFRFQDLKSLIYNTLKRQNPTGKVLQPTIFNLTRNYRSHDGILRVAASMLDLLHSHFPYALDNLEREVGTIVGPKPVIVTDTLDVKSFLSGGRNDGSPIEFGAGQVILVRNEDNIAHLKTEIKAEFALIMTVEQAKGMEFRDVVLYNLFSDSPANSQKWRIFLANVPDNTEKYPEFDTQKHNILATELKILYTAITRARARLWIWEKNQTKMKPVFRYWMAFQLVVTSEDGGESAFNAAGNQSTPEEWNKQGKMLFDNNQYENALASFKRALRAAGLSESTKTGNILLCEAYIYRERAKRAFAANDPLEAKRLYEQAANCFSETNTISRLQQSHLQDAAQCYEKANNFDLACEMYSYMKTPSASAIECYKKVKRYDLAGKALEALRRPMEALTEYMHDDHLVVDAIRIVREVSKLEKVEANIKNRLSNIALAVVPQNDTQIRKDAIMILDDVDKKKALLRSEGMFKDLVKIHQDLGELVAAAAILDIDMGQLDNAAAVYGRIPPVELPNAFAKSVDCQIRHFFTQNGSLIEDSLAGIVTGIPRIDPELRKSLQKVIALKGKLSVANSKLLENRLIECQSLSAYPKVDEIPTNESRNFAELHTSLKLVLSGLFLSLRSYSGSSASDAVKTLSEMKIHLAALTAFVDFAASCYTLICAIRKSWPPQAQIFEVANGPTVSKIRKLSESNSRLDVLMQLEESFYAITSHKLSRRIIPVNVMNKKAITWLEQKPGVIFDKVNRFECEVNLFQEASEMSIISTFIAAGKTLVSYCFAMAGLQPICLSATLFEGRCHKPGKNCTMAHVVSPSYDKSKMDIISHLISAAWFLRALARSSTERKDFNRELSFPVTCRFIDCLHGWDKGHSRMVTQTDLNLLKDQHIKELITDYVKHTLVDVKSLFTTMTNNNKLDIGILVKVAFQSRIFGGELKDDILQSFVELKTSAQSYPSLKQFLEVLLTSLYHIVYPADLMALSFSAASLLDSITDCTTLITEWSGILEFFEILTSIMLLVSRNQVLLPRRYLRLISDPLYVKLLSFSWPGSPSRDDVSELMTDLLSANALKAEDEQLRLSLALMLLGQDKNPGKPSHGIPAWITDEYPWPLLKRISGAGQDGLVLIWRDEVRTNKWTESALKIAKWQLRLDSLASSNLVSGILEVDHKTKIGLQPLKKNEERKKDNKKQRKAAATPKKTSKQDGSDSGGMPDLMSASESDYGPKNNVKSKKTGQSSKTPADSVSPGAQKKNQPAKPTQKAPAATEEDDLPPLISASESDSEKKPVKGKSPAKPASKETPVKDTKAKAVAKPAAKTEEDLPPLISASESDSEKKPKAKGATAKGEPSTKAKQTAAQAEVSAKEAKSAKPEPKKMAAKPKASVEDDLPPLISASESDSENKPKSKASKADAKPSSTPKNQTAKDTPKPAKVEAKRPEQKKAATKPAADDDIPPLLSTSESDSEMKAKTKALESKEKANAVKAPKAAAASKSKPEPKKPPAKAPAVSETDEDGPPALISASESDSEKKPSAKASSAKAAPSPTARPAATTAESSKHAKAAVPAKGTKSTNLEQRKAAPKPTEDDDLPPLISASESDSEKKPKAKPTAVPKADMKAKAAPATTKATSQKNSAAAKKGSDDDLPPLLSASDSESETKPAKKPAKKEAPAKDTKPSKAPAASTSADLPPLITTSESDNEMKALAKKAGKKKAEKATTKKDVKTPAEPKAKGKAVAASAKSTEPDDDLPGLVGSSQEEDSDASVGEKKASTVNANVNLTSDKKKKKKKKKKNNASGQSLPQRPAGGQAAPGLSSDDDEDKDLPAKNANRPPIKSKPLSPDKKPITQTPTKPVDSRKAKSKNNAASSPAKKPRLSFDADESADKSESDWETEGSKEDDEFSSDDMEDEELSSSDDAHNRNDDDDANIRRGQVVKLNLERMALALPTLSKAPVTSNQRVNAAKTIQRFWKRVASKNRGPGVISNSAEELLNRRTITALRQWPDSRKDYKTEYVRNGFPTLKKLLDVVARLEIRCENRPTARSDGSVDQEAAAEYTTAIEYLNKFQTQMMLLEASYPDHKTSTLGWLRETITHTTHLLNAAHVSLPKLKGTSDVMWKSSNQGSSESTINQNDKDGGHNKNKSNSQNHNNRGNKSRGKRRVR
ncbi:hypothetical protein HDV05_004115 [Chytridiales sp. JEL 0842]|nr:hypothetical protein HDV05_004115 [Chytridiales sp. JEL 0842]